jgi:hypothetical protein
LFFLSNWLCISLTQGRSLEIIFASIKYENYMKKNMVGDSIFLHFIFWNIRPNFLAKPLMK